MAYNTTKEIIAAGRTPAEKAELAAVHLRTVAQIDPRVANSIEDIQAAKKLAGTTSITIEPADANGDRRFRQENIPFVAPAPAPAL